ncbi:MAG: hypothetical protein IPJ66_06435, partial [Bacteroidetes bacterium]|nr:hypothetical protein [Bacteroidota bacterium]
INSLRDLVSPVRPAQTKGKWFFSHMGGMIGAYIAAVSAFSAVNFNFEWLPVSIQHQRPTIIGVPRHDYLDENSTAGNSPKAKRSSGRSEVGIQPEARNMSSYGS